MGARGKRYIYLCRGLTTICMVLYCLVATAQDHDRLGIQIDINLYNRHDDHLLDTTYMGNGEVLQRLDSLMLESAIINHTQRINVVSSSSIEGRESYNRALSQRRMEHISELLGRRYDFIADSLWNFSYIAENWSRLRQRVLEDDNLPNKDRVLSIIDMQQRDADTREYLLKILDGGTSWRYMDQYILPLSRGSASVLFVPVKSIPIGTRIPNHIIEMPQLELTPLSPPQQEYSRPLLSIRSNLLLDIITSINLSLEVPLTPRWSISAEYISPWWKSWDSGFTWQIESLYFDLRYWLGARGEYNTLTGWSLGAYAGSGRYDFQLFADEGVQGEYSDFGVTLSYAHKLGDSKRWLMEYTVGLGYVTTHYRDYYTVDDTNEYGDIKVHTYPWSDETMQLPMPTRLGVTLVYLINYTKKRGGDR